MNQTVLEVKGLGKKFGGVTALDNFNLEIQQGQIYGILGPNGSGKTTALAVLLGVLKQSSGSFSWFGMGQKSEARREIGSILEKPYFYPKLSLNRNLSMLCNIRHIDNESDEIANALERVQLLEHKNELFENCSLGMKQRLALAGAMMGQPKVLVLDEPTNGIDAEGIVSIRNLITELAGDGVTILLASHILDEVEKVCSHVVILKKGRILDNGPIAQVLSVDDQVELQASDNTKLFEVLESISLVQDVEHQGEFVIAKPVSDEDLGRLNKELAERGVFLNHLRLKRRSLESHFLALLEQ